MFRNMSLYIVIFVVALSMFVVPHSAYAFLGIGGNFEVEVGWALCKMVMALQGTIGKAISTIAVITLGIGAFFGKVTWGMAMTVATGVFVIFSAMDIVSMFAATGLLDLAVTGAQGILDNLGIDPLPGGFQTSLVMINCYVMGAMSII